LLLTPNGAFGFAVLMVLLFALLTIGGGRVVKKLFYMAWISEIIGIIIMWGLLASTSPASFAKAWDSTVLGQTLAYDKVVPLAMSQGYKQVADNSISATLSALPLVSLFYFGYYYQTIVAGEIKDVKKSIPLSIFAVFGATFVWWAVSATLNLQAFGSQWFYALSYLWEQAPSAYTLPTPTMNLMLSVIAYPNTVLMTLISITFIVTSIPMVYVVFLLSTRYFFAWGFDRVIPTKLAEVNPKLRTPVNATIALAVIAIIQLLLYLYTSFSYLYSMSVFMMIATFLGPSIAAILFPFVQKNLFEGLPPFFKAKVGSIPVLSMIGAACTISFGYLCYLYYITPQITSPGIGGAALIIGSFVLGIAIYAGSRLYWRRKGVAIDMAFKELPPD
jgi:APA family basic amino acid/polyamine antiporter